MDKFEIEKLPERVRTGELTNIQAGKLLWQEIYQKPSLFGLQTFNEDQKSDFLLHYHNKLYSIFDTYKPGQIRFFYYLKKDIELMKTTWLRLLEAAYIKEQLNISYISDSIQKQTMENRICENIEKKEKFNITNTKTKKKLDIARITSIILLLKACHSIDDQIIRKVAEFTGLTFEYLSDLIHKMKDLTKNNTLKRQKIIDRRDNAFFFHRRYTVSLKRAAKDSGNYLKLLNQYNFKTKSWKHQNELLRRRFKNAPSNSLIAEELGINERKIAFYIKQASKEKSSFRIETMKFLNEAFK